MLNSLANYGEVTGLDNYLPALAMAGTHFSGQLQEGDCCRLPFPDNHFSLVAVFEVLYHRSIGDVQQAVRECTRVLKPGGHLVVVDSAYSACLSAHDRVAHGVRRFNLDELMKLFQDAGLEIVHSTYAYSLLLPIVWMVRCLKKLLNVRERPGGELTETWGPLNALMVAWFSLEAQIAGRWGLPFGLSVQLLGRKPVS
jgi:ubiquinone/menaquinone biosynthesis C-methylase UbiE